MKEIIKKVREKLTKRDELRQFGIRYNDFYELQKIELYIFAVLPGILDELERRMDSVREEAEISKERE